MRLLEAGKDPRSGEKMTYNFTAPPQTIGEARREYLACTVFVELDEGWAGFETMQEFNEWEMRNENETNNN